MPVGSSFFRARRQKKVTPEEKTYRMKQITAIILAFMMLLPFGVRASAAESLPQTVSEAYVVMDAKTGQVLAQKNMEKREYPASITKILTAALGCAYGDPATVISVSEESVNNIWQWGETTHIALEPGEQITLRDALFGAMVESANDCANAIAQCISGNLADFVGLMNEQVAALGLQNTHFTNAHGLPDNDHYTTAYDMALITRWALSVEGFAEYFGAESYQIPANNKKDVVRNIGTHHHMLVESKYYYEYAAGGKLGWTTEAQHTIVTLAEKGGLSLICVCLNCPDKWAKYTDSIALFDYCFGHYDMVSVAAEEIASFDIPIGTVSAPAGMVHIAPAEDLHILVAKGTPTDHLALRYQIPNRYKVGERIDPRAEIYCSGELIGSFELPYTVETYAAADLPVGSAPGGAGSMLLSILKWMGIILLVLVVLLFLLRAYFMARRRKRRRHPKH